MIDARMKIRHLQCFMEVARLGHVGRAADLLAVTQPAVSKTLRELEEFLNVRLFTRGPKGLSLTPKGEAFQHYASTGVVALQHAIDSVMQGKAQGDSNIKIGALPTVAVRLMPQAVRALIGERRDASVHLITGPNRILLERLKSRELEVVVGRLADPDQMIGLAFEQLYLERMAVVVHPRHPLLGERPLDLRRIAAYQVLMPSREDITRPIADRLLIANGISGLERRIETVSGDFSRAYSETDRRHLDHLLWRRGTRHRRRGPGRAGRRRLGHPGRGGDDDPGRRSPITDRRRVHAGDAGRREGAARCGRPGAAITS